MTDISPRAKDHIPRDPLHWKGVARRYQRYLANGKWSAEKWVRYGYALKEAGELNLAAHAYAMGLSLELDNLSDAHLRTGHLRQMQGDTQKAVQSYKSALNFNPDNADAANELRALGVLDQDWRRSSRTPKKIGAISVCTLLIECWRQCSRAARLPGAESGVAYLRR